MERNIGQVFKFGDELYIVEKDYMHISCGACAMYGRNGKKGKSLACNALGLCEAKLRNDGNDVVAECYHNIED